MNQLIPSSSVRSLPIGKPNTEKKKKKKKKIVIYNIYLK